MANLPDKKDIIQIRIRTLNEEYTLPVEPSRYLFDKLENAFRDKSVDNLWIPRDVNAPDPGDIHPGFIKATFKTFLEKMGWEVKDLGDMRISKQEQVGPDGYALFIFFVGRDKAKMQEKATRAKESMVKIKKRKAKEKRKKKLRK